MSAPAEAPFTAPWAAAFHAAIGASAEYQVAGAKWVWPMALVLDATPECGYPEAVAVELQLSRGRCASARLRAVDALTAPFVLRASYGTWKSIVRGELDVITAVVQRKIRVKGKVATLMMHTKSATTLLDCARAVPTSFPDED